MLSRPEFILPLVARVERKRESLEGLSSVWCAWAPRTLSRCYTVDKQTGDEKSAAFEEGRAILQPTSRNHVRWRSERKK